MQDDILPPAPPGEESTISVEKKKGRLFNKLFSKKKEVEFEPSFHPSPSPPSPISQPPQASPEVPMDINLDEIRKQLGLEPAFDIEPGVPEPPRIMKAKKPQELGVEKKLFDFPIAEPQKLQPAEELAPVEEDIIEEPPKMPEPPEWISEVEIKKPLKEKSEFVTDVHTLKDLKEKSEFATEVKPAIEEIPIPPKPEFIKEVHPEEIKELAKNLKRKKFEEKKGIKYEPEVSLESLQEEPEEKEEFLLEESPEEAVERVKEKLWEETALKEEPKNLEEPAPIEAKKEEQEEKPAEEAKPISVFKTLFSADKDLREKLTPQIREEERAKLESEFLAQRQAFEREKQDFEQQKIAIAGKANKYDFRDKQFRKERAGFEAGKEQFEKDKQAAQDLLQKLPEVKNKYDSMKQDYDKLQSKMKEIYAKIKDYNEKEKELRKLEKQIEENEEALSEAQQRLRETEKKIEEKGFNQYIETELKAEPMVSPKFEEKDLIKETHLDVYNLIDECKSFIRNKNITEAKKNYMQLREMYSDIKTRGPEKELLYTAIRELYDDIKLGEMENPEKNPENTSYTA